MRATLLLKMLFVPMLVLGVLSFAPSAYAIDPVDNDNDSVPTVVEESSTPNAGDNNYDGVADSDQSNVATITNPNDTASPNAFVTLQVGQMQTYGQEFPTTYLASDWKIDNFTAVDIATLPTQPEGKVFPLGMFDIDLSCYSESNCYTRELVGTPIYDESGEIIEYTYELVSSPIPAYLTLIFDRVMDTSNWTMQKYDPITDSYIDYSPYVTISTQEIGYLRTVLEWSIIDGGLGDDDGVVNGYISDPIGPSVPVTTASTPATTLASTVATSGLQHTGSNFAIYSLILGFLMVATGAILVRKS